MLNKIALSTNVSSILSDLRLNAHTYHFIDRTDKINKKKRYDVS